MKVSLVAILALMLAMASMASAISYDDVRGKSYNVTYNNRAVIIDGKRTLLQSGSIHYPRSTPDMWPSIMDLTRSAHLNTIQIYLFWDYHMPARNTFDPQRTAELLQFLTAAADAGLFVILRIGPYVCAEWNYGGLPIWLREDPTMVYRTFDQNWMREMKVFVDWAVKLAEPFLPRNGGPIILTQIENEYGNVQPAYGANGTKYVDWCGQIAASYNTGTPWIMCQQPVAPPNIINTCNGFYCDNWLADHFKSKPTMPGMWTENWPGWFQAWGEPVPHRPVEDVAFSVARWVARGGTMFNYYMWHGGTTFGRNTGGPFLVTSYDYDVALNEYGLIANPKYSHSAALHYVLETYADLITSSDVPVAQPLGSNVEAHQYGGTQSLQCLGFLSNFDAVNTKVVQWHGQQFVLAAWSVQLIDCLKSPFQTLYVTSVLNPSVEEAMMSSPRMAAQLPSVPAVHGMSRATDIAWYSEPAGGWSPSGRPPVVTQSPTEQINTVKDVSDYLWYTANVTVTPSQIQKGSVDLLLSNAQDYVSIFLDGGLRVSARDISTDKTLSIRVSGLQPGYHALAILCQTMGTINYGEWIERWMRGLRGKIQWGGVNIRDQQWYEWPALRGEQLAIYTAQGASKVAWQPDWNIHLGTPLSWWKINIATPTWAVNDQVAAPARDPVYNLDMGGMGKGMIWVNGNAVGRHWNILATDGNCAPCDYRGPYDNNKCRTGCGEPSQRYYHVPASWLSPAGGNNLVVIFDEQPTADPSTIVLKAF